MTHPPLGPSPCLLFSLPGTGLPLDPLARLFPRSQIPVMSSVSLDPTLGSSLLTIRFGEQRTNIFFKTALPVIHSPEPGAFEELIASKKGSRKNPVLRGTEISHWTYFPGNLGPGCAPKWEDIPKERIPHMSEPI